MGGSVISSKTEKLPLFFGGKQNPLLGFSGEGRKGEGSVITWKTEKLPLFSGGKQSFSGERRGGKGDRGFRYLLETVKLPLSKYVSPRGVFNRGFSPGGFSRNATVIE